MQQFSQPQLKKDHAHSGRFTYVGNSFHGRYYSNWEPETLYQTRFGHFLKWSVEIQFALVVLGFVQIGLVSNMALDDFSESEPYLVLLTLLSAAILLISGAVFPRNRSTYWKLIGVATSAFALLTFPSSNLTLFLLLSASLSIAVGSSAFLHIKQSSNLRKVALGSRWRTRFSAIWLGKEIVIC